MASTECFSRNKFPLTEHLDVKLYPPIAPLGEASLSLQEIQAGVMSVSVGLLPGKCSKIMKKYIPVRDVRVVYLVTVCVFGIASFANSPFLSTHLFFLYNRVQRSSEEHRKRICRV